MVSCCKNVLTKAQTKGDLFLYIYVGVMYFVPILNITYLFALINFQLKENQHGNITFSMYSVLFYFFFPVDLILGGILYIYLI